VRGKPARRPESSIATTTTSSPPTGPSIGASSSTTSRAGDVYRLHRLRWVMQTSLLTALASKHRSTVTKIAAKHKATITTPHGLRTCYQAITERAGRTPLIARFGGIPLTRHKTAIITDRAPTGLPHPRKELITRLLNGRCELCQQPGHMQVHHVRKLADLNPNGAAPPQWATLMTRRRRKTLVVAPTAMTTSTPGSPPHTSRHKSLESPLRGQPARRVRREAAPEKDLHHRHLAARPTHPPRSPGGGCIYTGRSTSSARSSTF
jgi:hypothetical protein